MLEEKEVWALQQKVNEKILTLMQPEKAKRILVCFPEEELLVRLHARFKHSDIRILDYTTMNRYLHEHHVVLEKSFDYILLGQWLERKNFSLDLPETLGLLLKPDGRLFAVFANTMHWSSWSGLDGDQWQCDEQNILVKSTKKLYRPGVILGYWNCSFYRQCIRHSIEYPAPAEICEKLDRVYQGDETGLYQIAYLIDEVYDLDFVTVWLRRFFAEEIRRELAYTIHRIENDIDTAENCHHIWELCAKHQISSQYLMLMVRNVVRDSKKVFQKMFQQEGQ